MSNPEAFGSWVEGLRGCQGTGPGGKKDDANKLRVGLLPATSLCAFYENTTADVDKAGPLDEIFHYLAAWRRGDDIRDLADLAARIAQLAYPGRDLIPGALLAEVAMVLEFGAYKYGPDSWKLVPDAVNRYCAGLTRHLIAFSRGEITDSDSGLPHLAHAMCNVLFLLHFAAEGDV